MQAARPLVSYRIMSLGGGATAIGIAAAAFAALSVFIALPLGRYTDRTGRTAAILAVGSIGCVVAIMALAFAPGIAVAAAASTLLGFAHILLMVGSQSHVARWSTSLDRDFGFTTAALSAGQLGGPLLTGLVLGGEPTRSGTTLAGIVAAAVAAAAIPVALLLWRRTPARPTAPARATRSSEAGRLGTLELLRQPGVPVALLASLALLTAVDMLTAYLPLIAEERGLAPAMVGVLLALRAAASLASRIGLGALSQRWGRRVLLITSTLGSGIALAMLALPISQVVWMAIILVVGGFLLGLGQPLTMSTVVEAVPTHERGSVLALRLLSNRAGQITFPALAGLAAGALGGAAALWLAGTVLIGAGLTVMKRR